MFKLIACAVSVGFFALGTSASLADDWVAKRLRGPVLELVDGEWVKLARGDVVPDDRVIRTLRSGQVTFVRGAEVIELGGDTQIQIFDRAGRNKFTTVKQYFGTVGVEAEVRQVQHFSVQTPYLAAVVKGTRFVVTSDREGASVDVQRGRVAVKDRDTRQSATVAAGQSASSSNGTPLAVAGEGKLPVVFDAKGKPVAEAGARVVAKLGDPASAAAAARAAALAAGLSPKQAEKAAKAAEKAVEKSNKDSEKAAEKANKEAEKAGKDAGKASEKAGKEAEKASEKATKEAEKAAEEASKDAEKATEEASKEAEKAAKDKD